MKLTIDLDALNAPEYILCKTKEEWDTNQLSAAWHWKWAGRNLPHYQLRASEEPQRFPCIGLLGGSHTEANGPDEQHIVWIYDFALEQ